MVTAVTRPVVREIANAVTIWPAVSRPMTQLRIPNWHEQGQKARDEVSGDSHVASMADSPAMPSAGASNFEAITKAKADHNRKCPFPPHTVKMNPFEIERMGWEEGDTIAGLVLEADAKIGTGAFRLVCDGMEPPELDIEEESVIEAPAEPLVVPTGPAREGDPTA
jgi:hypothetical protein